MRHYESHWLSSRIIYKWVPWSNISSKYSRSEASHRFLSTQTDSLIRAIKALQERLLQYLAFTSFVYYKSNITVKMKSNYEVLSLTNHSIEYSHILPFAFEAIVQNMLFEVQLVYFDKRIQFLRLMVDFFTMEKNCELKCSKWRRNLHSAVLLPSI